MRICVKDATHLIEYAGGHFSEQGDYLFRLPLLDCLYRFPTKKARGITGSYMLIYIKCPMNFAHHTKHDANMVGYWPSYITAFLRNAGEVEVNKDANKERGQKIFRRLQP